VPPGSGAIAQKWRNIAVILPEFVKPQIRCKMKKMRKYKALHCTPPLKKEVHGRCRRVKPELDCMQVRGWAKHN
jgi:hypothetical protein